jgi:serine/threonine protein kinase
MKDVERALAEILQRGLLTQVEADAPASASGAGASKVAGAAGAAGATFSFDPAVVREITHWMQAHPEEKEGLSDERVAEELALSYAGAFERLADAGTAELTDQAATEARAALQCFLQAQAFHELGDFAGRLVTGTRDPELLGQVVDDFTASGVAVTFADYRVRRLLGAGGGSAVYEAERVDNALPVAIKVLRGRWSDDETDVLRFLDEAKAANRVRHPNVVEVFDAGHTDGTRFVAMELLRGRSLERRWRAKGRRLPLKRVLEIAMHVLGALAAAHEKSILHGGIRPSNIFITTEGSVKLLDFGFESLTRTAPRASHYPTEPLLRAFMAPEQVRGELPDPRTDLWSVGSTMLALLSGRPAESTRPTPVADMLPDAPESVVAVLDRALRLHRDERWSSAQEMWEAIGAIHSELPDPKERISDLGPGSAPLVETQPAGPLSERIAIDSEIDERRLPSTRPPPNLVAVAMEAPLPASGPTTGRPPPPASAPRPAPRPAPRAGAARDPRPVAGFSKPLFIVAVTALVAAAVAIVLTYDAGDGGPTPPPPPTATAPTATAPTATAPTTPPPVTASVASTNSTPPPPTSQASGDPTAPEPVSRDDAGAVAASGDKRNGEKCASKAECKSGECVDGVCCNSDCTGTCVACNLKSFMGMCAEIPYGYDPDRECSPKVCDGDGACGETKVNGKRCKAGKECRSGFCVRGVCCATECRGTDGNCSTGVCRRSLLIE